MSATDSHPGPIARVEPMRRHSQISPQAAARVVALTELADGDIGESEVELAESDAKVAEGEVIVLTAAVEHWGLQHQMLRSTADEWRARPD